MASSSSAVYPWRRRHRLPYLATASPTLQSSSRGVLFFCFLLLLQSAQKAQALSSDGMALLRVKAAISSDPLGLLSNWKEGDENPCSWTGITCDPLTSRVISVNITGEASCAADELAGVCTDGSCSPLLTCPSLSSQRCPSPAAFSAEMTSTYLCLRNGTVVNSSSAFDQNESVPCRITGSLSGAIGSLSHLQDLSLPFNALSGGLPEEIGLLSALQVLDLRGNSFSGKIPVELGKLASLKVLNLALNSLQDEIPTQLSSCRSLNFLNLAGNLLSGKIPAIFGNFSGLKSLILSYNQLDGMIPEEVVGGCDNLERLHLDGNFLFGSIPPSLGNCTKLKSLMVSSNFLSAQIPPELGKLSMLETLDVSRNSLQGPIPHELGNCTKLSLLVLTNLLEVETCMNQSMVDPVYEYSSSDKGEFNYFTGTLPASITRLPSLRVLWAPKAYFLAEFPEDWGDCSNLEVLNLGHNSFSGEIPSELTKCKKLIYIDISFNSLEGTIPQNLPVSCMVVFNVSGNFFSGNLSLAQDDACPVSELLSPNISVSNLYITPDDQGYYVNIIYYYFTSLYYGSVLASLPVGLAPEALFVIHDLSQNNLTGVVPAPILGKGLRNKMPSYGFFLSRNQFGGAIPDHTFGACQNLQAFAITLSHNAFDGALPIDSMLACQSLTHFEGASTGLSGNITSKIRGLSSLVYLDLGTNHLIGIIPPAVGQLQNLKYLMLDHNGLSGSIPAPLGDLQALVKLDLSVNHLSGEIPPELANLQNLKYLLLNNNSLSGSIPQGIGNMTALIDLDVSYNNLSGVLPHFVGNACHEEMFEGNPFLQPCTASAPAPSSTESLTPNPFSTPSSDTVAKSKRQANWPKIVIIVASVSTVILLLLLLGYCIKSHWSLHTTGKKEVVLFVNTSFRLTYENVVRATGNFSVDNLIGNGGFGATYKAEPAPGYVVAVKRLYLGKVQGMQQFVAEIKTLGQIRHPHLVTLLGYYAHESEMFLIYNFLPGGNLESLLHNNGKRTIPWKTRHKIALDVAQALEYLHNRCRPRVLHRDIKPSNILLDTSLNAYLSDFGLARLLGASETHATTDVAGTFGYVAPEYATTGRVSDKADAYSYGVVLLELLSGKKSLDPSFSDHGDGFNIVAWANRLHKRGQNETVFAPGLWEQGPHSELIDTLELAVDCTKELPAERPTMKQVVDCLRCTV